MKKFLALFVAFFALYALTAQRGLGWGDSAEFQDWVLNHSEFICGPRFSNAHPLYVSFCRLVTSLASTFNSQLFNSQLQLFNSQPLNSQLQLQLFSLSLVSSFFGALSVAGFYLITRRFALAFIFGLSQMLWWLSTLAEVQTMSLALTVFEVWALLEFRKERKWYYASTLTLLCGVHLFVHNFVLLCLPIYVIICPYVLISTLPYLYMIYLRGPTDVLMGYYAGKVIGVLPSSWTETAFNLALSALSFIVPILLYKWRDKSRAGALWPVKILFVINFLFFIRYFVQDQAQFLLPTLFFAYLLVAETPLSATRAISLVLMQIMLPVMAYFVVSQFPVPEYRVLRHPDRKDSQYFTLPWHFNMEANPEIKPCYSP